MSVYTPTRKAGQIPFSRAHIAGFGDTGRIELVWFEAMEQRLAAIMAADMAGYSRLMEADESGTLARLRTHRIELIDPAITKNKGRIIKTTGDGMLVEFQSVTDAVRCAVEIQQRMKRRNSDVPPESRIEYRIGINLGDIIFEDDDIFGEGVNIASRIEQLADVGGICMTAAVATQIADRLEISIEDLGEKTLKNISRPVRLYRIGLDAPVLPFQQTELEAKRSISKPSIVVLPFNNMSGDPEQEFFADGLTEDIITELSRHHELFVISRNSSFVYKNCAVNVREVAEKLGAQYLVEGSVRKIGDRVRVTVQLIDTASDAHIWADKYDRKLDDIFAIQDEVTAAIAATLPGRVEAAQRDQLARTKPANLAAYECVLAAKVLHHRSTIADNKQAQTLIERAVALDPDYAHAHAWRACILGQAWVYGWCEDKDAVWDKVVTALDQALALDDNDADVHRILAAVSVNNNALTTARYHQERALALNPNYDLVVVQQGELLTWLGRPEEGIEWIRKAMQLNPHHPERFWSHLGKAHFAARRYGEAIEAFMHLSVMDSAQHAFAAACYGWLGDEIAAAGHLGRTRDLDSQFSLDSFIATLHYAQEADVQHVREGLLKAGIMDGNAGRPGDAEHATKVAVP